MWDSPNMGWGKKRFGVSVLAKGPSQLLAFPEVIWTVCEQWKNRKGEGFGKSALRHKERLAILGG